MSEIDLSIAIPVYNNVATLDELIDRLLAVLEPVGCRFELIFVDDGSTDDSLTLLLRRAASDSRLRVFALTRNFGSQAAIAAGFDQIRGRRGICMDADLENCPEDIPALLAPLDQGYHLVCGYRPNRQAPWLSRRVPSWLMNQYVRRRTGVPLQDVGCGMRAFRSWVVRDLATEGEARRMMTPVFLQRTRKVAEVPLSQGAPQKAGGHSFLSLLAIAADYFLFSARRPFLVSGLASSSAILAGLLLVPTALPTTWGVLLISGSLGLLLSLIGEYSQRYYQLAQKLPFYKLRSLEEEGVV